jgi:DNA-binding NarL/FixJ family response regulator
MAETIKVILCDDHPLVLEGLKQLLANHAEISLVAVTNGAVMLQEVLHTTDAAILLLDLHLKDGDGLELCKVLTKSQPQLKIIGLSGVEDVAVISSFIKNGAQGYLLKTADGDRIIHAIKTVHQGGQYIDETVANLMIEHLTKANKTKDEGYIPRLSVREKEVLKLIIDERTTNEIAETLFISVNTVETHRNHLMQKLGARNLAGLVRIAIEKGLVSE